MDKGEDRQGLSEDVAPRGKRLAIVFAWLAALSSFASFMGWVLGSSALQSFGIEGRPIWPFSAIGYFSLAVGLLLAARGKLVWARFLWLVPLAIAGIALLETSARLDFGVDRLLFAHQLVAYPLPYAGRPGSTTIAILALLASAGLVSGERAWRRDQTGSLLASIALCLGATAAVLLAIGPESAFALSFSASLPGSLAAIAMAGGFVAWHSGFGWLRLFAAPTHQWRIVRLLLPLALVLPVLPSLLEFWIRGYGLISPLVTELLVVILNTAIVAALIYWGIALIERERAAYSEITDALQATNVAITTLDGRILHWSQGCEELYGWPAQEAIGQRKYLLLRSRCEQGWSQDLPRRTSADAQELVEMRADGSEVAVLERVTRVEKPGRQPVLVLGMTDLSQGVAAMTALRISEERLALATAAHELGIFEWDVPNGILTWSPGTEQRLGLVPGSMSSFESWQAQVEPEDVQSVLDTIARTVADRAPRFSFRYRFRHPNGDVRAVEGSSRTFYDAGGNLVRTVGVMLDVTEREEREAALRAREAQLRSILETVPDAMVVMDEQGIIRQFSAAAEQLWGYAASQVLGQRFAMLSAADERDQYERVLQRYLETQEAPWLGQTYTGTAEAADGRRLPVEVRIGLARADGRTLFTIFFRDLSDRLAAEERLASLNAELAHVSRQSAMSELAADLAHELNQPLSATSNFLAAARMLIERGEPPERVQDLLRLGSEQTLRAGEIIRKLREFMARREVEMRPESLERTVKDAVELLLVGTSQFDLRVSYDLDRSAPLIFADRIQVQQVLVNLLRNAMEAMRAIPRGDRQILIASRKLNDDMIEVCVSDSGPGIPESILKEIYSRFITTKDKVGGMGIGLSISRRIIEAHGGTLSAENRPEGGSTFRFTLPAVVESEEA